MRHQRLGSSGERGTESIAHGLEDVAAVSLDGFPEKTSWWATAACMARDRLPAGASLYIGEEESDGALWHSRHNGKPPYGEPGSKR